MLESGADIAQSNSKGQTLIEQLNPKSEMYKLLKKRMLLVRAPRYVLTVVCVFMRRDLLDESGSWW